MSFQVYDAEQKILLTGHVVNSTQNSRKTRKDSSRMGVIEIEERSYCSKKRSSFSLTVPEVGEVAVYCSLIILFGIIMEY